MSLIKTPEMEEALQKCRQMVDEKTRPLKIEYDRKLAPLRAEFQSIDIRETGGPERRAQIQKEMNKIIVEGTQKIKTTTEKVKKSEKYQKYFKTCCELGKPSNITPPKDQRQPGADYRHKEDAVRRENG